MAWHSYLAGLQTCSGGCRGALQCGATWQPNQPLIPLPSQLVRQPATSRQHRRGGGLCGGSCGQGVRPARPVPQPGERAIQPGPARHVPAGGCCCLSDANLQVGAAAGVPQQAGAGGGPILGGRTCDPSTHPSHNTLGLHTKPLPLLRSTSLQLRPPASQLNDPAAQDTQIEAAVSEVVERLFCVLATLGVVPIIRCPRGGAAEHVAAQVGCGLRREGGRGSAGCAGGRRRSGRRIRVSTPLPLPDAILHMPASQYSRRPPLLHRSWMQSCATRWRAAPLCLPRAARARGWPPRCSAPCSASLTATLS